MRLEGERERGRGHVLNLSYERTRYPTNRNTTQLYPFLEPHLLKADKVAAKYELLAKNEAARGMTAVKTGVLQK